VKKIKIIILFYLAFITYSNGQSKMLVGEKHTIFAEIPNNWLEVPDGPVAFFIKPNEKNISDKTYIYLIGHDYESTPDLDNWIEVENKYQNDNSNGLKIDKLDFKFENIKKDNFLTGRYKIITYDYEDKSRQITLVIECKSTIVILVLNAINITESDRYLNAFKEIANSIKILSTKLKE
jgi:hypothetical protein